MKHKSKAKTLSLMLSLIMLLALMPSAGITALAADSYPLWVGGEAVTADKLSGDGWSYNADSRTLTLTDYKNDNACYTEPEAGVYDPDHGYRIAAGIYYSGTEKLTVVLAGSSTLTMPAFSEDKLDNAAIFSNGDITFTGAGSLTATSGAASDGSDESTVGSFGVCSNGRLTFDASGIMTVSGAGGESSYGFYGNSVTVSNGSVTARGCDLGGSGYSVGVRCAKDITVTGGTLNAFGGKGAKYSYGVYSKNDSVNVTGGTLEAAGGTVTVDNGQSYGYYGEWGGVNVTDGGQFTAIGGAVTGAGGRSYGICSGVFSVTVQNGTLSADGGAVEGDGGKSYGLYSIVGPCYFDDGAKVDCKGRLVSGDGGESYGIRCAGLTLNGGEVTASGSNADDSCGIYNDISMTVEAGTLTANGGPASRSCGICGGGQIEVSGGKVTASGYDTAQTGSGVFLATRTYSNGEVDGGTLTVTGGEVTATGGTHGVFCDPLFDGKVIVITDGTVTASGKTVAMSKAPILGTNVTASGSAAFDGGAPAEYAEKNNGSYKWVKTVGDPDPKTPVTELVFTVEEPVAGAVPAKKVQIASVPENALTVTEYDAVWLESDDSLEFEPMTSPTFEAGKYYALKMPDEKNAGGPVIVLAAPGYAIPLDPVCTLNGEKVFAFMSYLDFFGPLEVGAVPVAEADLKEILGNAVCFTGVEGQEYVIVPKGETPTEDNWRPENGMKIPDGENEVSFYDLEPVTEYEIYTRIAQSETAPAGAPVKTQVMTVLEGFGIGSEGFGNALVGETFHLITEPESDELTYQWYTFEEDIEFGETPAEITPIPGATGTTYTLTAEDVGKRFGAKAFKNGKEVGALFGTDLISYASVIFDSKGGSKVAPLTGLTCGVKIDKPADPVREGYAFDGWYQEEECETPWNFDEDFVGFAQITLYAKWTPNGSSTSPQTGDNSRIELWIALMALSLCGLAATRFISKKKRAFNK
ncbi:MAG: InlB B-repeat-containing protein [Acutalibacteraceae bacterium]